MPDVDEIYGGQFLSAETLKSLKLVGKTVRISNVEAQNVGMGERAKVKLVLTLDGIEKQLVLNKTNSGIIAEAYGKDYSLWVDKSIILLLTKRQYQGALVDAINVGVPFPSPKIEKVMKCLNCNSDYIPGQKFCMSCGNMIGNLDD